MLDKRSSCGLQDRRKAAIVREHEALAACDDAAAMSSPYCCNADSRRTEEDESGTDQGSEVFWSALTESKRAVYLFSCCAPDLAQLGEQCRV